MLCMILLCIYIYVYIYNIHRDKTSHNYMGQHFLRHWAPDARINRVRKVCQRPSLFKSLWWQQNMCIWQNMNPTLEVYHELGWFPVISIIINSSLGVRCCYVHNMYRISIPRLSFYRSYMWLPCSMRLKSHPWSYWMLLNGSLREMVKQ